MTGSTDGEPKEQTRMGRGRHSLSCDNTKNGTSGSQWKSSIRVTDRPDVVAISLS